MWEIIKSKKILVALASLLLLIPSFTTLATARVIPTLPGVIVDFTTDNYSGAVALAPSIYKPIPINITSSSYLVYASTSNISVSTALMSSQQFANFELTKDLSGSTYDQNGTQSLNAILLTRGIYFLVMYANEGPANITYILKQDQILALNSSTYVGEFVTIPPFSKLDIPVHYETLGSPSLLELFGVSNQTINYSVNDNVSDLTVFNSRNPETVTNLSYSQGSLSLGYNLTLGKSLYTISLDNTMQSTPAFVYFDYHIVPQYVDPYLFSTLHGMPPAPTGIAAMGLYNVSGNVTPYTIESSSVVGFAKISSMLASDPNFTGDTNANLQLNSILKVENVDNSTFAYWPQNVLLFSTSVSFPDREVIYRNNILNITGDGATLSNSTITGSGYVVGDPISGYYYGNYNTTNVYNYDLPFAFLLYLNETVQKGTGVWIDTGIRTLENGTSQASQVQWFDRALIVDPNISSAFFLVSGNRYTPVGVGNSLGDQYDAELVFGGDLGGGSTMFSSLNAVLSLFYFNQSLRAFPSVYPFGADTAEGAYNIKASYAGQFVVLNVSSDNPTYAILTNNYTSSLSYLESSLLSNPQQVSNDPIYLILAATGAAVAIAGAAFIRKKIT
ncbi:MAG: thermopsin family protease [Nitrososphaerales archaeon]